MRIFIILICLFLVAPAQAQVSTVITSPAPFQIFQRSTNDSGALWIHLKTAPETAITGAWGDFTLPLLYSDVNGDFNAQWANLPVWQHDLILNIGGVEYTVENVGIGDVYLVSGQSNAVSAGLNLQMYVNNFGFRAGMFNVSGWHELADPVGAEPYDKMDAGGSQWPILATYIMAHGVPTAFGVAAVSGTQISTWQLGKVRYGYITALLDTLPEPRVRAILWQQGESDGMHGTSAKDYSAYLYTLASSLHDTYNVPFLPARLYENWYPEIDKGIDSAVQGSDFILLGADLTYIKPDNIHYLKDEKLAQEAWAWYVALVQAGFYSDDRIQ